MAALSVFFTFQRTAVGFPYLWVALLWIQPNMNGQILGKGFYIVGDVYYVVRPVMVPSVLNMYRLFPCYYSLNNSV